MSLSAEEIQKSLEASMLSMQIQMENDHKALNEKIANLEKIIKKKDDEIKELKDSMLSKKTEDEIGNKLISELNTKIRDKEKEISDKVEEHQKDAMEISNLKNQISQKTEVILQLEMDKKKIE